MPEKNLKGEIPVGRYIIGHDPVDNDQAESSSLSSTFVLDLFTDTIVAEYTGRHEYSEDNYEILTSFDGVTHLDDIIMPLQDFRRKQRNCFLVLQNLLLLLAILKFLQASFLRVVI